MTAHPQPATGVQPRREDLHATRPSLLERLRHLSDEASWTDFHDSYAALIVSEARKRGLNEVDAQDIAQETLISAAQALPGFTYDPGKGSFRSWLLKLTHRRISDALRKRARSPIQQPSALADEAEDSSSPPPCPLEEIPAPEVEPSPEWEDAWARQLASMAEDAVRKRINPRHFQIFDLVAKQAMPVQEVAALMGTPSANVYLIRHRVIHLIKREVQSLQKRLGK